jgi:hypothetical protein
MASAQVRDPFADHLLMPENAAFLFISASFESAEAPPVARLRSA